jgi:hypothetical protein
MSKVIRLTENDLVRLVKKVINETEAVNDSKRKNCVQEMNKFAKMNGFKDGGVFGDGYMHGMNAEYRKYVKGGAAPDGVSINIIDWESEDTGFQVEIDMSSHSVISKDKQGKVIQNKHQPLDSNVLKLISKYYKRTNSDPTNAKFVKGDLNCDSIKSEITNKLKPLDQQLIQMGYKKI